MKKISNIFPFLSDKRTQMSIEANRRDFICVWDCKSCTWLKMEKNHEKQLCPKKGLGKQTEPLHVVPLSGQEDAIPGVKSTFDQHHSQKFWAPICWIDHASEPYRSLVTDKFPNKTIPTCDTNCHILLSSLFIYSKRQNWGFCNVSNLWEKRYR